jgi:hypothetical protein
MAEDRGWMYGGWKKGEAHMQEWMNKTLEFINHAFSVANNCCVKCPCNKCKNVICECKRMLKLHLHKVGFMLVYEVWTHHGDSVGQTASVAEEDDRIGDDRMDEMFDAIQPKLETNPDEPPTTEVQKFFDILRYLEEPLHEPTIVSILAFIIRLMAIKSKFTFSNNCYNELLNLISGGLPNNHKMPKDRYQSKNGVCSEVLGKGTTYEPFEIVGTYFTCSEVGPTIQNIKMQCKFAADFQY